MEMVHEQAAAEVDRFLGAAMQKSKRLLCAEIARQGFESLAHRRLAQGGMFQVRPLGEPGAGGAHEQTVPERKAKVFNHHAEVTRDELRPDMYGCMPDSYPAVDGMAWTDMKTATGLCCFHMTVSLKHGMSASKLAGVVKAMGVEPQNVHLFWVVPSDMFAEFPVQPWLNAKGESELQVQPPVILQGLEQYVLAVPLLYVASEKAAESTGSVSIVG